MRTAMAFGWDYTAMVRRLALLEGVETLIVERESGALRHDDRQMSLPFPEPEAIPRAKAS